MSRRIHSVVLGERLSSIAALHGVSVSDIVAANPHKPRLQLQSGAVVFASLGSGERLVVPVGLGADPATPQACPSDKPYPDGQGNCYALAQLNQMCANEALPVDAASGWQRTFASFEPGLPNPDDAHRWHGWAPSAHGQPSWGLEPAHWDTDHQTCTQTFMAATSKAAYDKSWEKGGGPYVGQFRQPPGSSSATYFVPPATRRNWKPTPVAMAYAMPNTGTGVKSDALCAVPGQTWNPSTGKCEYPPCGQGMQWNVNENACVPKVPNQCPGNQSYDPKLKKCVSKTKTVFGPASGGGPGSGGDPGPASTARVATPTSRTPTINRRPPSSG
jgi:hypothetical protein